MRRRGCRRVIKHRYRLIFPPGSFPAVRASGTPQGCWRSCRSGSTAPEAMQGKYGNGTKMTRRRALPTSRGWTAASWFSSFLSTMPSTAATSRARKSAGTTGSRAASAANNSSPFSPRCTTLTRRRLGELKSTARSAWRPCWLSSRRSTPRRPPRSSQCTPLDCPGL